MKTYLISIVLSILTCLVYGQQLIPISDEFDNACSLELWTDLDTLEGWNASQLELMDIDITNESQMTLMPYTTAWFADRRSNLIFKEVSGNFVFTTHVSVTNRDGTDIPSDVSQYSLAGPLIRSPRGFTDPTNRTSNDEDYIFLSCGFASENHPSCNGCAGPHFEVKSTTNSISNLNVISVDTAATHIRIARIENAVIALYQLPGDDWVIRQRYDRNDLPDTLQAGLVAYTDWNKANTYSQSFHNNNTLTDTLTNDPSSQPWREFVPDVLAQFDFARYESFDIPAAYEGLDFSDPSEVNDTEILDLLGYESVYTGRLGWNIWKGKNSDWYDVDNWSNNTLPVTSDSILIPNCNCDEVFSPIISTGTYNYASLIVEPGADMIIESGSVLNIDLSGDECRFINRGIIYNSGLFSVINTTNKVVENIGELFCEGVGSCNFLE